MVVDYGGGLDPSRLAEEHTNGRLGRRTRADLLPGGGGRPALARAPGGGVAVGVPPPRLAEASTTIRVVVVDDHAIVREGIASLLSATEDIRCVGTTGDGEAALEMVERLTPDVVLFDFSMPGRDGVEVLRALRLRDPRVRILVLTAFGDPDLVLGAVHAGADGYLLKHSGAETILGGVRQVAAGAAPVDPTVARSLLHIVRDGKQDEVLTDREREVLELIRQGQPNKSIARRLDISEHTVKAHITRILQRIGVSDRTQAALWAERHLGTPSAVAARR